MTAITLLDQSEGKIRLPYKYAPRAYQIKALTALDNGYLRAVAVWHRRSGKDKTFFNYMVRRMNERVGAYYYFFPTYSQGRKILWEGIDRDGFKLLDHIPKELIKSINNQEMKIELINGSIFRVIGTDDYDSIVGTNPIGCVFSEYALQDPGAWDYIRPILAENGGWAIFDYTPRGENHGWMLYKIAKENPDYWFAQILTVDDTKAISQEILDQERKEYIAKDGNDATYRQEYYCDFKVPIPGAYYAAQIMLAQQQKRIGKVPWIPDVPVDTYWDLGYDDSMTIWFVQNVGQRYNIIDYYENHTQGFEFYAKVLQEKNYVYGRHVAPHDIDSHEISSGKTRKESAEKLGIKFDTAPKLSIEDGIHAVRTIFSRCYIDEEKCERGLNALKSYTKKWDEKKKTFLNHPEHNWASHGSDAFRTLAVSVDEVLESKEEATPAWAVNRPSYSRA